MKQLIFLFLFVNSCLKAQVYEFNTQSLGQWNGAGESYSDIWGYTANGREYAILGSSRFIYFFDVTNPANIQLVDKFGPYTATSWREFKTYNNFAYAVTDGPDAGGLRIFDLQHLPDTVIQVRQTTAFFSKCHMPFIDEANGRMYCAGTDTRNNGIIVLDLSTSPDNPSLVINQVLPRGYVHDVFVKNNIMYASHIYTGYISQYDCTGGTCTGELSTFQTGGYNHSSWMNADQTLLINAIETAGHPLWLFPIENNGRIGNENYKQFKSVTLKEQYPALPVGEGSIGHNPYIVGERAYVSYYTDGVQVYNISDVNNIRRVAYFDTDRGHTSYSPVFRGCWGTFPFLPSGNILAIDIQSGMWIFKTTPCANSQPPSISISSQSSTYIEGSSFTVNATVVDTDGTPVKVEFYSGGELLGTDAEAPFEYLVTQAIGNGYSFFAKVYDDCGIPTTSALMAVTVFSTCSDGIQNGSETGIDCGGSCPACVGVCITNLSQGQPASQSSTYSSPYAASRANDGSLTNFSHTLLELQPWWQVDLGASYQITNIQITNRNDCCANRIKRFRVFVSNSPVSNYSSSGYVYEYNTPAGMTNGQVFNIPNITVNGRYVRIWVDNTGYGNNYLNFAEVKVMGCSNGEDPCINNQSPTISISSNAVSYPQGSNFTINANAEDVGGSINRVEFYNGSTLMGIDENAPYNFTVNSATEDSYSIIARAIDNCNSSTTSNTFIIAMTGPEVCITNLSQGQPASQSSTYSSPYAASRANDGSLTNFSHTLLELQPWWQVDLGASYQVTNIQITNRNDCCANRIKRFRVFVSNSPVSNYSSSGYVYEYNAPAGMTNGQVFNIPNITVNGRYVRIWVDNTGYGNNFLNFAEVKVMGCSNGADPCINNQSPTISISSNAVSYPQGSNFTINASAEDVGGSINRVEFYNGSTLMGIDENAPYSFTVNSATEDSYSIIAKAVDNCNSSTTSNTLIIATTGPEVCITNLSQGQPASQSSTYSSPYAASRANDGSLTNFSHTLLELQPWWQVDLGSNYQITNIQITNRNDCCANRIKRFRVFVSNSPVGNYSSSGYVYEYNTPTGMTNGQVLNIPNITVNGRYVRIWVDNTDYGTNYLNFAEVKVMGCPVVSNLEGNSSLQQSSTSRNVDTGLRLFPNPTQDWIYLLFNMQSDHEILARIFDLQGRLLYEKTVVDNKINMDHFAAGSYFIIIRSHSLVKRFNVIKL